MEVSSGVHLIGPLSGVNAYLINAETLTLIDSGSPYAGPRVLRYIEELGRNPQELKRIVLTHSHVDHSGSARWLRRRTGARVLAHAGEAKKGRDGRNYVVPNAAGLIDLVVRFLRKLLRARSVPLDGLVEDGQVLPVAGGLRVIHTPGHSPGHICLYLENQKVLFAGDLVLSNVGRLSRPFPAPGTSPAMLETSLQRLASLDVRVLCCAHGKPLVGDVNSMLRRFIALPPVSGSWWRIIRHLAASPFRPLRRHW